MAPIALAFAVLDLGSKSDLGFVLAALLSRDVRHLRGRAAPPSPPAPDAEPIPPPMH
jgi:hypothetical protein